MNNKWYRGIHALNLNGAIFAIKSLFCPLPPSTLTAFAALSRPPYESQKQLNTHMKSERKKTCINSFVFAAVLGSHTAPNTAVENKWKRKKVWCRTHKQEQQRNTNCCSNYWFISHSFWIFFFFPREQLQLKPKIFIESGLGGSWSNIEAGHQQ